MPSADSRARDLHERLRQLGQRLTPQRMLILDLLHACRDHVTADEIHAAARNEYPYLNISTVYRTLELFRDLGLVTETDLGDGRRQFALLSDDRHHHLICLHCNVVEEVADDLLEPLRHALHNQYAFQARIDHLAIFGVCSVCSANPEREAEVASP